MADTASSYTDTQNFAGDQWDDKKITATKLRRWFTDSYRAHSQWREGVVELLKMLNNDPWPDEAKQRLREQNMSAISINRMLMPIMYIAGVQRQTRQEPKLIPFESGDLHSTTIMEALVHWCEEQSRSDEKDSHVFLDKISVGL